MRNGVETSSILLRRSKTDQDSSGKWLNLTQSAHKALAEWIQKLPEGQEMHFSDLTEV